MAALAQFYPKKYPDNFWVLLVCVGLYIAATLALNILFSGIDGEVFYTAKDKVLRLREYAQCCVHITLAFKFLHRI